ncbi:MAG: hypothetical protein UR51_C0020G0008 [Candidatus Moranbacteria bacterium GW2011_GWF1_34_10]|nr:MAG: hypothetical protein UR51_C0020G0008 [Candidatus Moranbacteria bacterium GW2011_GWF1_34_10]
MSEKVEKKPLSVGEILEKLYKLFHDKDKVGIKVTKIDGEIIVVKMFSFTKEALWGRSKKDNSWTEINLPEIADVVAF